MVLLHLASLWRDRGGPPLRAVHVHHGLSAEADDWARLCENVCEHLSIALKVYRVIPATDAGKGIEAAARTARYDVFRQELGLREVLLLAHHADDQVETVLQRLFRGTGPKGLAGMPRRRKLGAGSLSRPLLGVARSVIKHWADSNALTYVVDPSNYDERFDRGFLRSDILPRLGQRWPGYRESIRRATELQSDILRQQSEQPLTLTENVMGEPALAYDCLEDSHDSRRQLASALHRWLSELCLDVPAAVRLTEFVRQCYEARADRCPEIDIERVTLRAWRGLISMTKAALEQPPLPTALIAGEPCAGAWGAVSWGPGPDGVGFKRGEAVNVRYRFAGEGFKLDPQQTRDFASLCQIRNIPPWWRSRLPIYCRDEVPLYIPVIGSLWGLKGGESDASEGLVPLWQPIKSSSRN